MADSSGEPVRARDYHDLVSVAAPRVSPDGERVAFLRTTPEDDESYETTVYTVPVDGSADPARFTATEGVDAEPRWSPSGDRLAFVSDRGTEGTPQLRVLDSDGGESERLTDGVGGASNLAWSPDGTRIAFTQRVTADERAGGQDVDPDDDYERSEPDPRVEDRTVYRAFQQYFDGARSHVYVVEVDSGEATRVTDGDRDYQFPAWADDDHLYYAVKTPVDDPDDSIAFDVERVPVDGGDPEPVTATTDYGPTLAVSDDGRIAYPRTPPERASMQQTDVAVFDPETGEETLVTADLDRALHRERHLAWDDGDLYFCTPDSGHVTVRRAVGGEPEIETVVGSGHATGVHAAAGVVACPRSEADHPGDVFVSVDGETRRLSTVNADYLDSHAVCEVERLTVERDGHEIDAWVLTPPDFDPDGQYPLAVEVHGGPHVTWTASGTMWHEFQTLAARGYVVFWSNPRGSLGYGEAFAQAIAGDWGAVTGADVLAGVDAVAARDYVDADQQFLTGGSFGGYMTAWLVGHTDRFAGAVAQRGVYDLASFYGSTDGAYQLVEGDFDAVPWADETSLADHSPANYADDVTTPTLVVHAEQDYRVPMCNGELFYRYLRKQGVDTRLVRYPREGHELSRSGEPAHVVDRIERIARWFDGYSTYHDAPRALDRERNDGLSAGENGGNENGDDEN